MYYVVEQNVARNDVSQSSVKKDFLQNFFAITTK